MVFSGILRRDDHERLAQGIGLVVERDLRFAHRLQETALRFGRRSIDLIRQYDIGKNRTRDKFKGLLLAVENGDSHDIGRQQIARELNAFEGAIERSRETMSERGFPNPRHIFDEEMPSRQEGDDAHLDDMRFPFDNSGNILLNGLNGLR